VLIPGEWFLIKNCILFKQIVTWVKYILRMLNRISPVMKNIIRISRVILLIPSIFLIHSCKKEKPSPPVITTTVVTAISYTTATSGGEVTDDGGADVTSRGVCWNTSINPTIVNSKTTESGGSGSFISNITQLTPNTMYYVRAYATNSAGIGYGNQVTFTTSQAVVPVLTTTAITSITITTAVSGGNITADNGSSVTARGVCWGTVTNPTTANNKTTDGTGTGSFVSNLISLQPGTIYYVRSYATNSVGTSYGNEIIFTTTIAVPTLTTTAASSITRTSAISGGNISTDGGAAVTARGVCWSISANPTIALSTKTTDGTGTGSFASYITGLQPGTIYYVRAYATNSAGTNYGNENNFTTLAIPPIKPKGVKIIPGDYSLTISWDYISNQQYKNVKIYRDIVTSPSILYKEINYSNQYKDLMVALNKKYYYKISVVDNNNLESEKSDEMAAIPNEPINTATPINGEIGHIHLAYWNFPIQTFTKLVHNITIYNEPINNDNSINKDGLYFQFYQGILNDTILFYYGLQTYVSKPNGDIKKGFIFSRWSTRDVSNYKLAEGGWGQSAGYEGDFIGVRKNYDWGVGTYNIELRIDSSDTRGDWYSLWVTKIPNGTNVYMGSIRFERSSKSTGIKNGGITWTELYFKANANTPLPRWHVSVNEILADNNKPIHVTSVYDPNKFLGFTNIFTTNYQDVNFLMGPTVVKFHAAGLLW